MLDPSPPTVADAVRIGAWVILLLVVSMTLVLSFVFRRRYIAAVVRLQGRGRADAHAPPHLQRTVEPLRTSVLDLDPDPGRSDASGELGRVLQVRRSLMAARIVCDLLFWCGFSLLAFIGPTLITASLAAVRERELWPLRLLGLWTMVFDSSFYIGSAWIALAFTFLWLAVPPLLLGACRTALRRTHIYATVTVIAIVWIAESARTMGPWWPVVSFAAVVVAMAAAVLMLHDPRVRGAASPLIVSISAALMVWIATLLVAETLSSEQADANAALGVSDVLLLLSLLAAIAVTIVAFQFLLARAYRRRRVSDVELADAAFWLLAALAVFGLSAVVNKGGSTPNVLGAVGLLLAWTVLVSIVRRTRFRHVLRGASATAADLLILRVFKRAAQSEEFIDRLLSYWRFAGPVQFIAGSDLAGANLEPDEFFDFIRGRLAGEFVSDVTGLDARLDGLERKRDPDGRFRVNELFCTEQTWRHVVGALMGRAGVVLLDLREYVPDRSGVRYEIHQLINAVPLDRILVVIGESDDAEAIAGQLREAWTRMADNSPNRGLVRPALQLCRLRSESAAEVKALFVQAFARLPSQGKRARISPLP